MWQHLWCMYGMLVCIPAEACCMSGSAACTQDAFKRRIIAAACTNEHPLCYTPWHGELNTKLQKEAKPHATVFCRPMILLATESHICARNSLTDICTTAAQNCSSCFDQQPTKGWRASACVHNCTFLMQ